MGPGASMVLFTRHVTTAAHILALIVAILMIVWVVHYQGGANINSEDANTVFNVSNMLSLSDILTCNYYYFFSFKLCASLIVL